MARRLVALGAVMVGVALLASCDKSSSPATPSPDCTKVTLSPQSQTFPGGAGTGTIAVTVASGCSWTAAASATWISLTSGTSGSGPGTVSFAVAQNPLLTPRTAAITASGQQATVSQSGTPNPPGCTFELRPDRRAVPAAGAGFLVMVFAPFGCRWTFESQSPWLQIIPETEGAPNGNGNGSVEAHAAANPAPEPRTGTGLIAGQVLTVTQDGTSTAACSYQFDPGPAVFAAAGGTGRVTVSTSQNCSWWLESESGGDGWIRLGSGSRGAGPATVTYTVLANTLRSPRSGNVVLSGDSGYARLVHVVQQAGASSALAATDRAVTAARRN